MKNKVYCDAMNNDIFSVKLLKKAETTIVKIVQENWLGQEIGSLKSNRSSIIPKLCSIQKLDVFLDIIVILRVQGRLKNSQYKVCNSSSKEAWSH